MVKELTEVCSLSLQNQINLLLKLGVWSTEHIKLEKYQPPYLEQRLSDFLFLKQC
jgi:hypothetical protein